MVARVFNKIAGYQNPNDLVLTVSASNSDASGDISCSGVDDLEAWQEGLDWLNAKGGGVLMLADGDYFAGASGCTMHEMQNVHIVGNSWRAKLDTSLVSALAAGVGTAGFAIAFGAASGGGAGDAKNCSVQGFWMLDDDTSHPFGVPVLGIGEGRTQCQFHRVIDMKMEGYGLAAIAMVGVDPYISGNQIDDIGDEAVQFSGVTRGIISLNQISNTGWRDGGTAALRIIGTTDGSVITGNSLKNINNRGLEMFGNNCNIQGNIFDTFDVVTATSNPLTDYPLHFQGDNNLFSGNLVKDVDSRSTGVMKSVRITGDRNVITQNNFVQTTTNAGLFDVIAGATNNYIGGNFTNGGNITESNAGTGTLGLGANTDLT